MPGLVTCLPGARLFNVVWRSQLEDIRMVQLYELAHVKQSRVAQEDSISPAVINPPQGAETPSFQSETSRVLSQSMDAFRSARKFFNDWTTSR
jgi:hypothetical protein